MVRLCMLHDDDVAAFPYRARVSEAIAELYAKNNGLQLIGVPHYGFVSRVDEWIRFRSERPQWFKFAPRPFWTGPRFRWII